MNVGFSHNVRNFLMNSFPFKIQALQMKEKSKQRDNLMLMKNKVTKISMKPCKVKRET